MVPIVSKKFPWASLTERFESLITFSEHQRRVGAGTRKKPGTVLQSSDSGGDRVVSDYSASGEAEADASNS